MLISHHRTAAIVGLAVLTLGVAGCSSDADDAAPTTESTVESTATAGESTAETTEESTDSADSGADSSDSDAAASSSEALDEFVATLQENADTMLAGTEDVYLDFAIEATHPGTVEYIYTFADEVDPAVAADGFESTLETFQELTDSAAFPEMEAFGITEDPRIIYTYLNPDGSEVWTHEFVPSS